MDILIDNKNLLTYFGITCLDYTGVLSFAAERINEREWHDKSGVDKNLANIRYSAKEFILHCIVKSTNEAVAYNKVATLVTYMKTVGCFVLSIRDTVKGIRECFLCERSSTIVPDVNIRYQNSVYVFKLGLKDINPNALRYLATVALLSVTINYTKGQWARLYWGDGTQLDISNSGNYTKTDYAANGLIDIMVDIDKDEPTVTPLVADFSADITNAIKPQVVQFTDLSTGTIVIWSWDFGDGHTSSEQSPEHEYTEEGVYTVVLQVFNSSNGSDIETKVGYITIRNAVLLIDGTDNILINGTDNLLIN